MRNSVGISGISNKISDENQEKKLHTSAKNQLLI